MGRVLSLRVDLREVICTRCLGIVRVRSFSSWRTIWIHMATTNGSTSTWKDSQIAPTIDSSSWILQNRWSTTLIWSCWATGNQDGHMIPHSPTTRQNSTSGRAKWCIASTSKSMGMSRYSLPSPIPTPTPSWTPSSEPSRAGLPSKPSIQVKAITACSWLEWEAANYIKNVSLWWLGNIPQKLLHHLSVNSW